MQIPIHQSSFTAVCCPKSGKGARRIGLPLTQEQTLSPAPHRHVITLYSVIFSPRPPVRVSVLPFARVRRPDSGAAAVSKDRDSAGSAQGASRPIGVAEYSRYVP